MLRGPDRYRHTSRSAVRRVVTVGAVEIRRSGRLRPVATILRLRQGRKWPQLRAAITAPSVAGKRSADSRLPQQMTDLESRH